jgi:hypothetical protein
MNNGWAIIDSLRNVAGLGMPYAKKIVEVQHKSFMSELADSGQLEKFIIGIKDADDLTKTTHFLREQLTEQAMKNASYSLDAASLVFAHTVLEDGINSYLGITYHFAPDFWKDRVKKKQFDLETVMEKGLDDLVTSLISKEIWSIRRSESLGKKVELLLAICKPTGPPGYPEYNFDAARLKAIDKLRQDIVHGDLLGTAIADIDEKLEYLRNTGMHFFMMMHKSLGLRIDTTVLTSQPTPKS